MDITILGIESSCDDTSAAVIRNNDAAVERHRLAGRAHEIRRRDPRTGLAGPPAEHHPGGRHGPPRGRRRTRTSWTPSPSRAGRDCSVRCSSGVSFAKGLAAGARHPDGRGEPLAGTYPLALPRPARPRRCPTPTSRSSACSSAAGIRRSCGWTRRWRWRSSARRSTTPQEKRSTSAPK